jgi:hypothetical protein
LAEALHDLVAAELGEPVDPRVAEVAAAIAARYGEAARAVLFYGSCLRQRELGGLMLDFYLIVSDYREAYGRGWLAFANRLIPPNVFPFEHQGLVAKYAVLSEADLARECGPEAGSVSVWARFAQPARLVWAKDEAARTRTVASVARAAPTLFALTRPMMASGADDPVAVFRAGFALTYGAELRAERQERSGAIVDADPDYYRRLGVAVLAAGLPPERPPRAEARAWRRRRRKGKALTVVRLMKASTTFAGGIDYLAWKINRHAGTRIEIKPWQRRWPLVGALILLPRLLKRGAIR